MQERIAYKIFFDKVKQHLLRIECIIQTPAEQGQIISIPTWVPGSYMIRDFAKHVVAITASGEQEVAIKKINKNTWICEPCYGPLKIEYLVYCFDLAARGAYVDHQRVFFDGCRVFLVVEGEEEQTKSVELVAPENPKWHVATTMRQKQVDERGFGVYLADNHLDLIDHPFEISNFQLYEFMVANCVHKIVINSWAVADFKRLINDVQKICNRHVDFFGELPPMPQYIFFVNLLNKGWGGIEHRSSSSLVCARGSLPIQGMQEPNEEYISLLGLFSHEYFHIWNVKRIKPEVFINPNLNAEVYTRQLWIFEGITAYFDNLGLISAGVIKPAEYLKLLQDDINSMLLSPGTNRQNLEESSFDAWIKFYYPDENSINSTVSYYLKGSLVALALDLLIIKNSNKKQGLADIMQVLWQQYGKTGLGLPENYFEHITYEVTAEDYSGFFAKNLRSALAVDLSELLLQAGVIYQAKTLPVLDSYGIKTMLDPAKIVIKSVLNDSVAEYCGLAPNDIVIAINNLAVNPANLELTLASYRDRDDVALHVFRNDVLLEFTMLNPPALKSACELRFGNDLSKEQELICKKWLGGI